VKPEVPVAGASVTVSSNEQFLDSERTEPSTPAPTSESPTQGASNRDNGGRTEAPKSPCHDDSLSHHEPLAPDSNRQPASPTASPSHERAAKRQRGSGTEFSEGDFPLAGHIFELSSGSEFQQYSMSYPGH
jgi:hypothetical protein